MMIQTRTTRAPMAVYEQHLARGELAYQYSLAARRAVFYPRVVCPFTGSSELEWRVSRGEGTVYSATIVSQRNQPDHCVVLVDLDEGFRMLSRIVGTAASEVRIGARVKLRMVEGEGGKPSPFFEQTGGAR